MVNLFLKKDLKKLERGIRMEKKQKFDPLENLNLANENFKEAQENILKHFSIEIPEYQDSEGREKIKLLFFDFTKYFWRIEDKKSLVFSEQQAEVILQGYCPSRLYSYQENNIFRYGNFACFIKCENMTGMLTEERNYFILHIEKKIDLEKITYSKH